MAEVEARLLLRMFRSIALTKAFNGRFVKLKQAGRVPGPIHQTEGQEAVGVGVCAALRDDDYVVNYYRGFAEWIARGVDLGALGAELLGKAPGLCGGKGGEMTLADPERGIISCSGIIGGAIPTGTGVAFAAQSEGRGRVAAVLFGDGAVNTGAFHEGINMAAVLGVPAVFVCLNNQYGISTYIGDVLAGGSIAARAGAYGIPGMEVDGNDAVAVYEATVEAVARARAGDGPSLIDARTYRIGGHSSTNPEVDFMDDDKYRHYRARDPLAVLRQRVLAERAADDAVLEAIESEVDEIAEAATRFALDAPYPDPATAARGAFA